MDSNGFSRIRRYLGKTQIELARLLNVSPKALQSFEQGWRNIPGHAERQILVLLALKRVPEGNIKPCWQIRNCPAKWRENCIVWEYKARHFCWFLNGTYCQGELQTSWDSKIKLCRQCEVFRAMLPDI
jgi:DNA-binding XRE family transcriptional regulator